MATFKLNLKIDQGADYSKLVTWKAGPERLPVDLTGCTARLQARARVGDAETLLGLTSAADEILLGGTAGTVEIVMTGAETELLTWTKAVYHLEITFPSGRVKRFLRGAIAVSPELIVNV